MKRKNLIGIICTGVLVVGMLLPVSAEELDNQIETDVEEIVIDEIDVESGEELVGAEDMRICGDESYWTLNNMGELNIYGRGDISSNSWMDYSSEIKKVIIEKGISSLPDNAFKNCNNLSTVIIPSSVKTIGAYAFEGCAGLTSVTISEGVEEIGYCAFYMCKNLSTVVIPRSVKTIGGDAFRECIKLTSVTISEGVEEIGYGAFYMCKNLPTVVIPSSVKSIGAYAFEGCAGLTSVTISEGVEEIDYNAFYGCSSLKSITIPEGMKKIGYSAFKNTGLTEVGVPISVELLEGMVFEASVHLKVYKNTCGHSYAVKNNNPYSFYDVDTALRKNTSGWVGIPSSLIANLDKSACVEKKAGHHDYCSNTDRFISAWGSPYEYLQVMLRTDYSGSSSSSVAYNNLIYDNPSKTYMKIHCEENDEIVNASYFDEQFRYLGKKAFQMELPIYGGFYESAQNYFLVFGQHNLSESDSTEVIRLVKYDKSWNRIASASVNACNTVAPISGGSDITMIGDALIVRTGHTMYKSGDGLRHQSCLSIEFDTRDMTVTSKDGAVSSPDSNSNKYGYVSHSFNQLIEYDENEIFLLDHGDGYPRAFTLLVMPAIYYDGKVLNSPYETKRYDLMTFPGSIGANFTGASVGGMVLNNSTCLIAGASLDLSKDFETILNKLYSKNVFIIVYNRETNRSTIKYLTNYKEAEIVQKPYDPLGATNPYIIRISENRNQVLWNVCDTLYQVTIDDYGNMVGSITSKENTPLSDCEPILVNGKLVWFKVNDDGTYFYDNSPNPNPGPSQKPQIDDMPFVDVAPGKYYYEPVKYAYKNNITSGTSETTFSPDANCTRGQVVTFLWRAMGSPEPSSKVNPFVDVSEKKYFYKPVMWAYENGVTTGTSATTFSPGARVTRGQFVTFLYKAKKSPSSRINNPFTDVAPGKYYYDAVMWAYENGITSGTSATTFGPENTCTRAQVVTFIYKAVN